MTTILLAGCQSTPMTGYLKALAVLRLVAEQHDPLARGCWTPAGFELRSTLDDDGLVEFLAERYTPTPIVAPWNGGSGFYPKDNQEGIGPIETSDTPRLRSYRAAIAVCRDAIARQGLTQRPADADKRRLLAELRATLADDALPWLDAVVVIADDKTMFPPLLGTGGNDGRLDFTNNQMQRLVELLLVLSPQRRAALLRAALFDAAMPGMDRSGAGQFAPAAAGGANSGPGFDGDSVLNLWDYVLTIEGSVSLAATATRRDEVSDRATLVFPFTVRAAAAGYGSAVRSEVDSSRDEIWLPLWSAPASQPELARLFGEGRAKVGRRAARTGVDFARAIANLGVDRGIRAFERYGFHVRNGLAYFAVPLGDWTVKESRRVDLLSPIDVWLDGLRQAGEDRLSPSALRRAASQVDDAIMALCRNDTAEAALGVLVALGRVEAVAGRSPQARDKLRRPLRPLNLDWLPAVAVDTVEFRLAAALASAGFRRHLGAFDPVRQTDWLVGHADQVWGDRDLVRNLSAALRRRDLHPDRDEDAHAAPVTASLSDIAAFIDGETDGDRLDDLLHGLSLLRWSSVTKDWRPPWPDPQSNRLPSAAFAQLRSAYRHEDPISKQRIHTPGLLERALSGNLYEATRLAERRLRGAGLRPSCGAVNASAETARRTAAALLFPITRDDEAALLRRVQLPSPDKEET